MEIIEQKDTQEKINIDQRTTIFDDGCKIESVRLKIRAGVTLELLIHTDENGEASPPDIGIHNLDLVDELTIYGNRNEENRKLKQLTKKINNFRVWKMSMGDKE